jgi:hypothetical protein
MVDTNVVGHDKLYLDNSKSAVREVLKRHGVEDGSITGVHKGMIEDFRDPLKKIFPEAEILTNTELWQDLGKSFDIDRAIYAVAEDSIKMGLWKRYATDDGKTHELSDVERGNLTFDDIRNKGIFGVSNLKSGFLMPVEVSLMIESVLLAARKRTNKTYELAGRDMHLYIRNIAEPLKIIHAALVKELAPTGAIDTKHDIIVTTTLGLRFAELESRREEFERIVSDIKNYRKVLLARRKDPKMKELIAERKKAQAKGEIDEVKKLDSQMGEVSEKYKLAADEMSSSLASRLRDFPDLIAAGGSTDVPYNLDQFQVMDEQQRLEEQENAELNRLNTLGRKVKGNREFVSEKMRGLYIVDEVCRDMTFGEINELLQSIDYFTKRMSTWGMKGTPPPVSLSPRLAADEEIK